MKAVGVIVEYNPFHNGHLYHLQETKKESKSDVVIAVMSGNFLQRGEPALVSKWARTKMALSNGVDLVIELPFAYATQKAETFAYGAVSLLDSLFASELCFGSEAGTIDEFSHAQAFLDTHESEYNQKIKHFVQKGNSYPKAKSLAFQSLQPDMTQLDLSKPNNILGYHYVNSIKKINSSIEAKTIKRNSANYHDQDFASESIASATSIRNMLQHSDLQAIKNVIPPETLCILEDYKSTYGVFSDWERYFPFLRYKILTMDESQLHQIYGADEGLEFRLKKHIQNASTFKQFMETIKTKRYTWTRLQRYCLHTLTNVSKDDMSSANHLQRVPYIRVLGMNSQGQAYLNKIKKDLTIPIITKPTDLSHPLLDIENKVSSIYRLIYPHDKQNEKYLNDYKTPPIRLAKYN